MATPRPETVRAAIERFAARTPTLPPATTTNSYALGGREVLLVEPATPYEDEQRAWLAWARGLESRGRRPVAIFLTHHHPDHVGGARRFAGELALPLWGHARTDALLDLELDRHLDDGDRIVLDGPEPQTWHCLHTPGHAPGHLCLHETAQRILVVGDMVASEGTIVVAPDEGDLRAYLEQLERLAGLGAELALPAHGAPIEEPTAHFERYLAHRRMREDKVLAALRSGGDLDELVPLAYDDTPSALWPLAKLSLEAHLIKLRDEGRAAEHDGRWRTTHP